MSLFQKLFGKKTTDDRIFSESFDDYEATIFPIVKAKGPDGRPSGIETNNWQQLIQQPWLGDLTIFYAAQNKEHFRMLYPKDLPAGYTTGQLHERAVENMYRTQTCGLLNHEDGFTSLYAGSRYEPSTVCLSGLWQQFASKLNDNLIITIPAVDYLLFAPESNQKAVMAIRKEMEEIFRENAGDQFTKTLFKYDKKAYAWSVYEDETR